ncbi:MAG TPA: hypothetical protein VFY10_12715 [Dehalococcoidia bacterium]|nr:hypothetical protein [Dehalococcoidia bacterium]
MIEEEGPFTKQDVDLDEWKKRARNVNAAIRVLQIDAKAPKPARFGNLKFGAKKLNTGSSHSPS